MKLRLLYIQSSKEPWAEAAEAIYAKKLRAFGQFEALALKAKSHARAAAELKRSEESQLLASRLEPHEINVLFDERGKSFSSSESFSWTISANARDQQAHQLGYWWCLWC
jgi:23S rRNA pseudoU1915 N3-methylase RlmH